MTTNKEALQKIFEAALKQPELRPTPTTRMRSRASAENYARTRSYGESTSTATMRQAVETVRNEIVTPNEIKKNVIEEEVVKTAPLPTKDITSTEPASASDQKPTKDKGRWKLQWLLTSIAIVAGIGGGIFWMIQSPKQGASIQSVITEVQATTETQSIASTGKESFDEAVALSNQADQATSTLSISSELPTDQNVALEENVPEPER